MLPVLDSSRMAFVLAALTALRAIGPGIGDPATHAGELIFGFLSLQLFGFLTVALPRWIGRPIAPPPVIRAGLLVQAVLFGFGQIDLDLAALLRAAVWILLLTAFSLSAVKSRSCQALPVLALAGLHGVSGLAFALWQDQTAKMVGLGAILAICLEISNRVGAAVIAVARERSGHAKLAPPPRWLSALQRWSALVALALWTVDGPAALPSLLAAASGLAWLAMLKPWQLPPFAGVIILAIGMMWKRLAFLLVFLERSGLVDVPASATIHAFTIGGLATLALAIASSIIRKKRKQAFIASPAADIGFAALALAPVTRLVATVWLDHADLWLDLTRWLWAIAFAGYLVFLLSPGRQTAAPAASPLPWPSKDSI